MSKLWKPTDIDFIKNPYPYYESILKTAPVFQSITGDYVIMGYAENKQILLDPSFQSGSISKWLKKLVSYSARKDTDFSILESVISGGMIQMNSPRHSAIRTIVAGRWPKNQMISELANNLSWSIIQKLDGEIDLVTELSRKLPVSMISQILGIKLEDAFNMMPHGFNLVNVLDPYETLNGLKSANESANVLNDYFSHLINQPESGSMLSELETNLVDLKKSERVALYIFLFIAGFETTSSLISQCICYLSKNESIRRQITKDENLIQPYVREVLRLWSPVQITGRCTTKEVKIGGIIIPANHELTLCLGSANRDPDVFEKPNDFLLNRNTPSVSFGYGLHQCLGSYMAIIEAASCIQQLLPVFDRISLVEEPTINPKLAIRSFNNMKIRIAR